MTEEYQTDTDLDAETSDVSEARVSPDADVAAQPAAVQGGDRVAELEAEVSAGKDRLLRLAAEFDNYRKRVAREQQETVARAQASLVTRLAEVLDDLDRVAHHSDSATKEALLEGVNLVERKFRQVMESSGLERIDPRGVPFDPATMEALMSVPTDDPAEDELVADVFQAGYRYQGTLVRPARVTVKKHGA